MDVKTLLQSGANRRSLLKGMGVAAIGLSFGGGLAGCSQDSGKKLANGEDATLNFYNWDDYTGLTITIPCSPNSAQAIPDMT
jgi:spermidine/putrescine transport system substrate-binding protein